MAFFAWVVLVAIFAVIANGQSLVEDRKIEQTMHLRSEVSQMSSVSTENKLVLDAVGSPTARPSKRPTARPSARKTESPSSRPSKTPTRNPTRNPTRIPTPTPSRIPTAQPISVPLPTCIADSSNLCINAFKPLYGVYTVPAGTKVWLSCSTNKVVNTTPWYLYMGLGVITDSNLATTFPDTKFNAYFSGIGTEMQVSYTSTVPVTQAFTCFVGDTASSRSSSNKYAYMQITWT